MPYKKRNSYGWWSWQPSKKSSANLSYNNGYETSGYYRNNSNHAGKRFDFSSKGVKTPYFNSSGWRAYEVNSDGSRASYESFANRSHESIMATQARFSYEAEQRRKRDHEIKMEYGFLAPFILAFKRY